MSVLFIVWSYNVTYLEFASVITAFVAIGLCIKGTRWGWPFYFLSSLLYGWLFIGFDLFASAATQLIFMAAAVWGWFSWGQEGVQQPGSLTKTSRLAGTAGITVLWVLLTPLLQSIGGVATWGDAFMLAGSIASQLLMVLQKVEAWPIWVSVNAVGTVLYASQGLFFTAVFYAILIVMALTGWRSWSVRSETPASSSPAASRA